MKLLSGSVHKLSSVMAKLVLLVLASLLVSFVVTAGVTSWVELRRQSAAEVDRLTRTAEVIGSLAADAVRRADRAEAFTAIRSISRMPDVSYARLETNGALLAETGAGARLLSDADVRHAAEAPSIWTLLRTGSIQVTAPVVSEGERVGSITLFSRTPALRERLVSTLWTTLAGALAALLAGLLVAMKVAARISRPIVALAHRVRQAHHAQDFTSRLEVKAEGEVGDLVDGFDALLAGIRERDARIAAHIETLEAQVEARTAELSAAKRAAEAANEAKSDFLAVMSHEIRTPLNGVLALSEMLADADLPKQQKRHAGVIAKSGRTLLGIINDILDFSKVEAGKLELEAVQLDLAEVLEDVASLFAPKAAEKSLDLAVYVDPALNAVLGDPTRLRQVVSNLVNNAIKFTESGGVLMTAEPTPDGAVRIAVRDTGPGIPQDKLPGLFDAFSQMDQTTTRRFGGTGLGLTICDRLVKAMGGSWDLSSRLGEGSTFAFRVPLPAGEFSASPIGLDGFSVRLEALPEMTRVAVTRYVRALGGEVSDEADAVISGAASPPSFGIAVCDSEEAAAVLAERRPETCCLARPLRLADLRSVLEQMSRGERPRLAEQTAARTDDVRFPGAHVLVVDDAEVNREVAVEALTKLGARATVAESGPEAIERMREDSFDLVLMDGSMPEMDGFETARRIRAEELERGRPRTPILALTAHVVGAAAEAWRGCGMDGVIHKPFSLGDLRRELLAHCGAFAATGKAEPHVTTTDMPAVDDRLLDPAVRAGLEEMRLNGRAGFFDRIHGLYADQAPLKMAEARAAAAAGDGEALARAAHALRSMSLNLGAQAVSEAASAVEASALACGPTDLERLDGLLRRTLSAFNAPAPAAAMGQRLRAALAAGEIGLVYQPLVDRTGRP
ncbi:MAG: ATP-binding protein, partial [Brevundimonas sp.]